MLRPRTDLRKGLNTGLRAGLAVLGAFFMLGAAPEPSADGELISIPMPDTPDILAGRVCTPRRGGPWNVVVLNHGSPPRPELRPSMQPAGCDSEPVRWFTQRGYLVVAALRRGFGLSTGAAVEDVGECDAPDYTKSGLAGARDIDAILRFALALPQARRERSVVIGQSTGGWATIAYNNAEALPSSMFISIAGGRGAHAFATPPTNCRPDLLVEASARFGGRVGAPMLWISAENDSFFPVGLISDMQRAYNRAGGDARLVTVPAVGHEGHALFYASGGSKLWGPVVERYLAQMRSAG